MSKSPQKKLVVIMGGSTGSGKTTHGKLLARWMEANYVSSGDIARNLMDGDTARLFKNGQLSPHENDIREAIFRKLNGSVRSVLDGFPRLKEQYQALNAWSLLEPGAELYLVWLDVHGVVLRNRWRARKRDEFDGLRAYMARHRLYEEETKPVLEGISLDWISHQIKVRAERSVEEVQREIQGVMRKLLNISPDGVPCC